MNVSIIKRIIYNVCIFRKSLDYLLQMKYNVTSRLLQL